MYFLDFSIFANFKLDETFNNQQFYMEFAYDSSDLDPTYRNLSDIKKISQKGVYVHPIWDGDVNKGFDVAIVKLANSDRFHFNKNLKPVKLEARDVPEYARFYMLGFGRLNRDARDLKKKMKIDLFHPF